LGKKEKQKHVKPKKIWEEKTKKNVGKIKENKQKKKAKHKKNKNKWQNSKTKGLKQEKKTRGESYSTFPCVLEYLLIYYNSVIIKLFLNKKTFELILFFIITRLFFNNLYEDK